MSSDSATKEFNKAQAVRDYYEANPEMLTKNDNKTVVEALNRKHPDHDFRNEHVTKVKAQLKQAKGLSSAPKKSTKKKSTAKGTAKKTTKKKTSTAKGTAKKTTKKTTKKSTRTAAAKPAAAASAGNQIAAVQQFVNAAGGFKEARALLDQVEKLAQDLGK